MFDTVVAASKQTIPALTWLLAVQFRAGAVSRYLAFFDVRFHQQALDKIL